LKIEIGSQLLPVINQLVEAHKVENRAIEQEVELRKELARMSGLNWTQYQHLTSEQKKAYESQARLNLSIQSGSSDAEKMMSVNKNLANTLTEVSDAAVITAESMNAINTEYLGTLGQVQSAETSYQDNAKSLLEERARLEQERADAISQGWWEGSEKIKEFDAALIENNLKARENATEHELANRKIILGLLERKLTADGVLDDRELQWLLDKGVAWGIYSQTVVDETARAIKEANNLVSAINAIPTSKSFTMFMNMNSSNAVNVRPGSGRASGGPVSANSMYVVGEEGPELFVPNQSGTIIPNGGGAGSGGGRGAASSIVVNLSMNSVVSMADRESMKRLTPFIIDGIREAQAQGYIK
jgi:phage-related minor tail protein